MLWTEALATDPFSSNYDCTTEFEEDFVPSNQKKLLYRLLCLHEGHHLWNLHEDLGYWKFRIHLFST